MAAKRVLEPLPEAMASLPVPKSRATGLRWLRQHPGLGVSIGGRHYLFTKAREAIGQGMPLAEAAKLGAAGERAA